MTSTSISPLQELNHLSIEDRTKGNDTVIMKMLGWIMMIIIIMMMMMMMIMIISIDYLIVNFDHPSALETSLLIKHINQLKLGIYMRCYAVFNS